MKRMDKIENVVGLAKMLMQKGAYVISRHAKLRQGERCFTLGDIKNLHRLSREEKR